MRVVATNRKNERGDTIIEVLMCILVISMILAGAFASTNKNLQSVRDSQERAQAVKIAESQLERLRTNGVRAHFALILPLIMYRRQLQLVVAVIMIGKESTRQHQAHRQTRVLSKTFIVAQAGLFIRFTLLKV